MSYQTIVPKVNQENEFLEIASDFGNPLEVIREAISNSYDKGASELSIDIYIDTTQGSDVLMMSFTDDGEGMTYDRLTQNFWNLGDSSSKGNPDLIGEKGHGTKIYLRAERIEVTTSTGEEAFHSYCDNPFRSLNRGILHEPKVKTIDPETTQKGTKIILENYSKETSHYRQDIIVDYIYWFTKHGSVEKEFEGNNPKAFTIKLSALDKEDGYEVLEFGHRFAKENSDINQLFEDFKTDAVDHFVKKYVWEDCTLDRFPYIKYDVVIYVEGDKAKRKYNHMLAERKSRRTGKYKVSDRYGLWLCKDYIPIENKNSWVSNFGTGSNSVVMLHAFVNCQHFKLTANRGTIANTNIDHLEAVKGEIQNCLDEVNEDLYKKEIYTLKQWQNEHRTKEIEKIEFKKRSENVRKRKFIQHDKVRLIEPKNESELSILFNTIYNFYPDNFDFEPLDYNTSLGIDILARNNSPAQVTDSEFWYVELKYILNKNEFNHSFQNIRKVICWEFNSDIKDGTVMTSKVDSIDRVFKFAVVNGKKKYFLDSDQTTIKIEVIRLREYMEDELDLKFT
ncbi:ATP-binding protein [Vallitaleaceae bacterium 9-2]